ncbi:MAG: M56 family metallopeptidase [Bacteroidaceae bacterium]|nr:M56 family metallopeptidase [Bacteroidaceae bacterium]
MLFIIKSAITLALLYSCFFLFLSKETFHRFNRIMLVSIMFVSLITPLFHITTDNPSLISEEFHMVQTLIEETPATVLAPAEGNIPTWMDLLTWIYLVGVAVMTIITIAQIISLVRFMSGGLRHTDSQGNTVILHNCEFPPFSIFRYIVMSVKDYEQHSQYILSHEQEHIRLGHTYDILLLQVVKIIQWFNLFIWFVGRDLKSVHEYEADQAVINQGIDAKSYQQILVTKVVGNRLQPFTNNLNHGSLKKRITMMYKKKSNRWLMLKSLCAIPAMALAINAFATPEGTTAIEKNINSLEQQIVPSDSTRRPDVVIRSLITLWPEIDQYGRIIGFSRVKKVTTGPFKDMRFTYHNVFINGRQATNDDLLNHDELLKKAKFSILKNTQGTAEYNYKDKDGVLILTIDEDGENVQSTAK